MTSFAKWLDQGLEGSNMYRDAILSTIKHITCQHWSCAQVALWHFGVNLSSLVPYFLISWMGSWDQGISTKSISLLQLCWKSQLSDLFWESRLQSSNKGHFFLLSPGTLLYACFIMVLQGFRGCQEVVLDAKLPPKFSLNPEFSFWHRTLMDVKLFHLVLVSKMYNCELVTSSETNITHAT